MKELEREILLAFWKVHILHHAGEGPLHGQWMVTELRHHGYEISPGTLYPLLQRMERMGWLKSKSDPGGGKRARKDYRLTPKGRVVLGIIREQLEELYREVGCGRATPCPGVAPHPDPLPSEGRAERKANRRKLVR
jgi:PadR family transcriptional regulator PadR